MKFLTLHIFILFLFSCRPQSKTDDTLSDPEIFSKKQDLCEIKIDEKFPLVALDSKVAARDLVIKNLQVEKIEINSEIFLYGLSYETHPSVSHVKLKVYETTGKTILDWTILKSFLIPPLPNLSEGDVKIILKACVVKELQIDGECGQEVTTVYRFTNYSKNPLTTQFYDMTNEIYDHGKNLHQISKEYFETRDLSNSYKSSLIKRFDEVMVNFYRMGSDRIGRLLAAHYDEILLEQLMYYQSSSLDLFSTKSCTKLSDEDKKLMLNAHESEMRTSDSQIRKHTWGAGLIAVGGAVGIAAMTCYFVGSHCFYEVIAKPIREFKIATASRLNVLKAQEKLQTEQIWNLDYEGKWSKFSGKIANVIGISGVIALGLGVALYNDFLLTTPDEILTLQKSFSHLAKLEKHLLASIVKRKTLLREFLGKE